MEDTREIGWTLDKAMLEDMLDEPLTNAQWDYLLEEVCENTADYLVDYIKSFMDNEDYPTN